MLSDVATVVALAVPKVSSSKTADPDMPVFITGLATVKIPAIETASETLFTIKESVPTVKFPSTVVSKLVVSDPVTVKAVPDSETIESDIVEPVAHLVKLPIVPVPCTPV